MGGNNSKPSVGAVGGKAAAPQPVAVRGSAHDSPVHACFVHHCKCKAFTNSIPNNNDHKQLCELCTHSALYHGLPPGPYAHMERGYGPVYSIPSGSPLRRLAMFLGHRGPDCKDDLVGVLAFVLHKLGVPCFFDRDYLKAGVPNNAEAMRAACHQCALAVVVVSETFFDSKWCQLELNTFAWRSDAPPNKNNDDDDDDDDRKSGDKPLVSPARIHPVFWRVSRDDASLGQYPHMRRLRRIVSSLESKAGEASRDFTKRMLLELLGLEWLQHEFPEVGRAFDRVREDQQQGWPKLRAWVQEYVKKQNLKRNELAGLVFDPIPAHADDDTKTADAPLGIILGTPPRQDPWYVSRSPQEEQLEQSFGHALQQHQKAVVMGPGGSGKSQVSLHYSLGTPQRYAARIWLNGASHSALMSSYGSVARSLQLPTPAPGQEHSAVIGWMRAQRLPCLIVVDNVDHVFEEIAALLPPVGHVLLTSRDRRWDRRQFDVIGMKCFTEPEAFALLGEASDAARELSQRVDFLPVALGVARSAIEAERLDDPNFGIAQYLKLLQTRQSQLTGHQRRVMASHQNMDVLFASSIERMPQSSQRVLQRLAYVQPDSVAYELVSLWTGGVDVEDAVDPLVGAHLVRRVRQAGGVGGAAIALHRVLQDALRRRYHEAPFDALVDVVEYMGKDFVVDYNDTDHSSTRMWAPHVRVVVEHALAAFGKHDVLQSDQVAPEAKRVVGSAGTSLVYLGEWYHFQGQYPAAKAVLSKALAMLTSVRGNEDPMVIRTLWRLGSVCESQGDFDGALGHLRRAQQIAERTLGSDHIQVGTILHELGTVLQSLGDHDGALQHLRRALVIDEHAWGSENSQVGRTFGRIGQVLRAQGDLDGALQHFRRAQTIFKNTLGKDHPHLAAVISEIGLVLERKGDLDGALDHHQRSLAMKMKAFGDDHPEIAVTLSHIGLVGIVATTCCFGCLMCMWQVLERKGDLDGALQHHQRSLAMDMKAFGDDHPTIATVLSNIGNVLKSQGDLDGALQHYQRSLTMKMKAFGDDSPDIAVTLSNIGGVLKSQGDLDGALQHYQRALDMGLKILGSEHPSVAIRMYNIGNVLERKGDLDGALEHFRRALTIEEKVFGADHPEVAVDLHRIGQLLQAQGHPQAARQRFERALRIRLAKLGPDHQKTAQSQQAVEKCSKPQ